MDAEVASSEHHRNTVCFLRPTLEERPAPAPGPDDMVELAAQLGAAARGQDDLRVVRATRRYLLALLDHVDDPWVLDPIGPARRAPVLALQRQLIDLARRLALAVGRGQPGVDPMVERLTRLTEAYRDAYRLGAAAGLRLQT